MSTFQRKTKSLTTFVCFKRSSNKQEDPFSKIAVSGRRVIFAEKIFGGARIRKLSRSFQKCDHCGIAVRSDCQISSTSRVRIPLKCKNDPKSRFESTDRIIATPTRQFFSAGTNDLQPVVCGLQGRTKCIEGFVGEEDGEVGFHVRVRSSHYIKHDQGAASDCRASSSTFPLTFERYATFAGIECPKLKFKMKKKILLSTLTTKSQIYFL